MLSLTVTMGKMAPYSDRERSPSHQNYSSTIDDAERAAERNQEKPEKRTSNEYALGVAFWSFVIFTATQFFFAIIANSSAMMTDCEAMIVDSLTYLFNLVAERLKRSSISEDEANAMHPKILAYRRERLRLYLELCPPLISATILVIVTFSATQGALKSLSRSHHHDNVNVNLMLIFSFGNLLLDVLNVGCFANAHQAYGIGEVEKEKVLYSTSREARREEEISENTSILPNGDLSFDLYDIDEEPPKKTRMALNLNMCSAYTHVMADTLRSVAVLIAAFIAFCFDSVQGSVADSLATLVVSVIILFSLLPLLHGLFGTLRRIIDLRDDYPVIDG